MVLTAYFALSPVIGLSCHRRLADTSAKLDAGVEASGPHDFTVRSRRHSSLVPPRPSHPLPYVRDDRETPLCVGRDASDVEVIWVKREPEYFCEGGWTGGWRHSPTGKISRPARRLLCAKFEKGQEGRQEAGGQRRETGQVDDQGRAHGRIEIVEACCKKDLTTPQRNGPSGRAFAAPPSGFDLIPRQ